MCLSELTEVAITQAVLRRIEIAGVSVPGTLATGRRVEVDFKYSRSEKICLYTIHERWKSIIIALSVSTCIFSPSSDIFIRFLRSGVFGVLISPCSDFVTEQGDT